MDDMLILRLVRGWMVGWMDVWMWTQRILFSLQCVNGVSFGGGGGGGGFVR